MNKEQITKLISGKTILVVDDNSVSRRFVKLGMKKFGLNVVEADTFDEAAQILDSQVVDLILMDLQMPEIQGVDATKIIRSGKCFKNFKDFKNIPIIAFTATSDAVLLEEAIKSGMNDCYNKGSRATGLVQILIKWLSK